jgi:hypothetical protein
MAAGVFLWAIFTLIGSFMSGREEYKVGASTVPIFILLREPAYFFFSISFVDPKLFYIYIQIRLWHSLIRNGTRLL